MSGSFFGPRMIRATINTMPSSSGPMFGMFCSLFGGGWGRPTGSASDEAVVEVEGRLLDRGPTERLAQDRDVLVLVVGDDLRGLVRLLDGAVDVYDFERAVVGHGSDLRHRVRCSNGVSAAPPNSADAARRGARSISGGAVSPAHSHGSSRCPVRWITPASGWRAVAYGVRPRSAERTAAATATACRADAARRKGARLRVP